jgi:hypothetical protein
MADTKISALAAVTAPATTDEFAVNQSSTSKKMTLVQIATFGTYTPGSFTVQTGGFANFVNHLTLTGSQRFTGQGTSRLRIN